MASKRAVSLCAMAVKQAMNTAHLRRPPTARTILKCPQPGLQTRCYASNRSQRAPSSTDVYTLADIPLSSIEDVISRNGGAFKMLSPAEYYAAAEAFAEAISRGSNPYNTSLPNHDAEILHQVACIMRQTRASRSADAFAIAMWASASEAGHRAATLSLARQLIRSGAHGRLPALRKVEARFRQLVESGKDADALTAQGELLFEQGRFDVAAAALRRALALRDDFEWRSYCELCLAKSYRRMGKTAEAKEILDRLSAAGLAEADVELVDVASDPAKIEQYMYNAACHGRLDMFTRLSEAVLDKDDGRSNSEKMLWALEWARLAEGRAEHY